jgi:hypothetical protein
MTGSAWRAASVIICSRRLVKKDVAVDEQRVGPLSSKGREHCLEITFSDRPRHEDLHPDPASRVLHGCRIAIGIGVGGIDQHCDGSGGW